MADYPVASVLARDIVEVQRTNHYVFEIYNRNSTSVFIPELTYAVKSVRIPNVTIEVIELKRGNQTIKLPGAISLDTGSLVLNDLVDQDTEKKFELWKMAVYDHRSGKMGRHQRFKKDAKLFLLSPCGDVERVWKLEGVWPTTVEASEMTNDSADLRNLTVTLAVDKCYREEAEAIASVEMCSGEMTMPEEVNVVEES